MKTSITTSKEARTLTLQPIGGGLYVLPNHLTKHYWYSRPLADIPPAKSLSGVAASLLDQLVFMEPEIDIVLTFDEASAHPIVAGVTTGSFLPPNLTPESGQKIAAAYHDALRELALPVIFSQEEGGIYANLAALEPEHAASIGYHVASDDVSIPQSLRVVPVGKKKAGLSFPYKTFDELKIHGVVARGAYGYDGENLHLTAFWVADPLKAAFLHPFLSRLAAGTEVREASEGREEIPDAYIRLPWNQVTRFDHIGGLVYLEGEEILCNPLDLILPVGLDYIHGLPAILSCYSPCSVMDADHLLWALLRAEDGAVIELGSSAAVGRHLFFNGRFLNMSWGKDPAPIAR